MTALEDEIPTFIDDDEDDAAPPIPFRISYRRLGDEERQVDDFTALPSIPYAYVLDLFASGNGSVIQQSAAQLEWFERVIAPEDRDRFFRLIHDPGVRVQATTLRNIAMHLVARYQTPGPTRARPAERSKSRSGSGRTKSGSTGRSRGKASTSR